MGDQIAISLKNVSKCFKCYDRPIDRLKEILLPQKSRGKEFWALNNINLEINKGETLGIVGRNGSGKSTLLQIIVGTLTPTFGEVNVNGRISALLELGSGFNPEFTGRQNVFFNGKILGLSKAEIEAKFDDIASFADIGDFIEQPVKTYSSGMFVRLAFAVAINVNPDILIVDEALAVGDEAFQRKCFAKIKGFQEAGKTILFVSHNAGTIIELCNRAILINNGSIKGDSLPKSIIALYHRLLYSPYNNNDKNESIFNDNLNSYSSQNYESFPENKLDKNEFYDPNLCSKSIISYNSLGALIENPHIENEEGQIINNLIRGKTYIYTYQVKFYNLAQKVRFGMFIKTLNGLELGGACSHLINQPIEYIEAEKMVTVKFEFTCLLLPGVYFLNAGVNGVIDNVEVFLHRQVDAVMFRVQPEINSHALGIVDLLIKPHICIRDYDQNVPQETMITN